MFHKRTLILVATLWQLSHAALPIELRGQQQNGESRLLHQMLQLFTPEEVATPNPMIPPYGINAKKAPSSDLVENQRAIRNEAQFAMSPWAKMAEEVMGMFGTKPSTPPPAPSTEVPIIPNNFGNFMSFIPNVPMAAMPQGLPTANLANSITSAFQGDMNQAANYIDTGGQSFDRFVIHEKQDGDNILGLGNLGNNLMGKWKERGLQWSNGNLRLVNMNGNNLLGSQVAVHDRSVDIPVQQWLNMASNLFDTYRGP